MKNLWTTVSIPAPVAEDSETIKGYEKTIKDMERAIKLLKDENAYLMSSTGESGESGEGLFPLAESMKTTAEKKRDEDLGAVRSVLARRIREKIIESANKGEMSTIIYVDELVDLDEADEITGGYSHAEVLEPIIKSLHEEGYQAGHGTTSIGGVFRNGYQVSWG